MCMFLFNYMSAVYRTCKCAQGAGLGRMDMVKGFSPDAI